MNIIEFIKDPNLIGGDLSEYQETLFRVMYDLELSESQKRAARDALDTVKIPHRCFFEVCVICGRRSGKTDRIGANSAVYEAVHGGHDKHLSPGQIGIIGLVSQDMRASQTLFNYIKAKFENSPLLSQMVSNVYKDRIELTNGMVIHVFPCSFRATRGFSMPVVILDELAFFRHEGAVVDKEVIDALRPAMATFPHAKLIKISSPYAKQGELYKDFANRHKRPDLLVFKAESWKMNPSIRKSFLDKERERDPEFFDREYAANFSDNISTAFSREAVEACVVQGRYELPFRKGFAYFAGVDPSGGGADEFTLSVAHKEDGKILQDCLRAYRSKRPHDVVEEIVKTLKQYHIKRVVGDRYSGEWVRQAFKDHGIDYEVASVTASEAFLELLPMVNQGSIELLDDSKQTHQLIALERRTSRTGKDTLGHPPGGHDDRPNSLALAAIKANKKQRHSPSKLNFNYGFRSSAWKVGSPGYR